MPRIMDDSDAEDLRRRESPHAILAFLTIDNAALAQPIRLVADPISYIVGADTFVACPFEITVVTDTEDHPTAQLRIQNVSRQIGDAVLAAVGRITADVTIRSTSGFDLSANPRVEVGGDAIMSWAGFDLVEVTVNDVEVTARLMLRDYSQEPWPSGRATKSRCPALFR